MRYALMSAALLAATVTLTAADEPPGQPKVKVFGGGRTKRSR